MDLLREFNRIMENSVDLALATVMDGIPNVRIMNFCYDPDRTGVIYLLTDRGSKKTQEFEKNNQIAFSTIPTKGLAFVRSNQATICKSEKRMDELKDLFIKKIHQFERVYNIKGEKMHIYEIHLREAVVTADVKNSGIISF